MPQYCPECARTFDDDAMRLCPHDGSRVFSLERGKDPLIGMVIDERFRIEKLIGEGGMGSVYRGVQLSVNRDVAVKVLRPELANRDIALERFFREARTISQLTHPNIVRLIEFGQDRERDLLYLVMELVNGFNLADLLSKGRMRLPLALDIAHQVCGALSEPHNAGVIHRDLKPDNILVMPMADGSVQAKVLDFGIARALEANTQITATGMVCGTPAYMAPEQAQNETLDSRADLYALGVIFFEMVSGWPPFSGTNSLQVMIKHIQESPPQLRSLIPGGSLPNSVEELTSELMSKSREKRPTTARSVRERIETIQREMHLDRVPSEAGMTFDQVVDAWLLPKLPNGEVAPSGPTQGLRRETDVERYLTKIDDDKPTNVYPFETKDEIYPTTPLQNPDVIKADRVKVHAGDPDPFAATGVLLQTPEATQVPVASPPPKTETNPEARPHVDSTVESTRPKEINADRSLSVIAIGIGVVTLLVSAGVIYLFWSGQHKQQPTPVPVVVAPPTSVVVPKPVGPVVDLARANIQFALRDGSIAQAAVQSGLKINRTKPEVKPAPKPQPTVSKDPAEKEPKKNLSEDAIFGNGSLRKDH